MKKVDRVKTKVQSRHTVKSSVKSFWFFYSCWTFSWKEPIPVTPNGYTNWLGWQDGLSWLTLVRRLVDKLLESPVVGLLVELVGKQVHLLEQLEGPVLELERNWFFCRSSWRCNWSCWRLASTGGRLRSCWRFRRWLGLQQTLELEELQLVFNRALRQTLGLVEKRSNWFLPTGAVGAATKFWASGVSGTTTSSEILPLALEQFLLH